MPNFYAQFKQLFPDPPLMAGEVISAGGGEVTVQLPGGGSLKARGEAAIGSRVFIRDGVIEGPAPVLPIEIIDV